jgi:thiol-disulfide isomerase/thioredoxin
MMHRRNLGTVAACVVSLLGCSGTPEPKTAQSTPPAPDTQTVTPARAEAAPSPLIDCANGDGELEPEDVEIIQPDAPVPEFHVATTRCEALHSDRLFRDKPLVLVFFSSWCGVCEKKMPVIREAMEAIGDDARFIGVSLDDAETWAEVAPFLERHGVSMPVVRGDRFRRFSRAFNPFRSIPVVVVVGRGGVLVDLQLGYSPFDKNRLLGAVWLGSRSSPSDAEAARTRRLDSPRVPADPAADAVTIAPRRP